MTVEHGIMSRVRALSEQICEPGYRAVRSPLLVWVRSYTAPQLEILELQFILNLFQ